MTVLAPISFTPKLTHTQSPLNIMAFDPLLHDKMRLYFVLPFALQMLWRTLQPKYKGNRKWAKSIDKYVRRFLKQFTFYPLTHRIDSLFVINQPIFTHIAYLKSITQPLSKHGFNQFLEQVNHLITKQFSQTETTHLAAKQILSDFVRYQNDHFIIQEYHYAIPAPPVKPSYKENPLIIAEDYVAEGKKLVKIVKLVLTHWQTQARYTPDEIVGWLSFSGIIFGGINYQLLLSAWLETLLQGKLLPFDNERLVMSVCYPSDKYGNELQDQQLFNTQQVIVDLVSQCWLYRYSQLASHPSVLPDISQSLFNVLQPFVDNLGYRNITLNWLLKNASYFWTMLPQVNINQALVGVMQGKHQTTGLITDDFISFLQASHLIDSRTSPYNLIKLAKLTITSDTPPIDDTRKVIKAQVRKSDLIERIQQIFSSVLDKKTSLPIDPLTGKKTDKDSVLIERLQALQLVFCALHERILIGWIIALLQAKTANHTSILHYLGIIGYEWLYFTNAQAITLWTQEDFAELYDEILDYKSQVLGNEDIGYAARRLQALHDYGVKAGLLPVSVTIEQAKTQRKVRAEWLSPQTYLVIIQQIQRHVTGLDRDMLMLLFIFAYRLGMRKKELLGLTFGDLEALNSDKPSLVIRPNQHRSTKTEGSIRRIPFFGLLTASELAIANNYLRSHHGGKASRLVFSFSDSQTPLPSHFPLKFFQQVLSDIQADSDVVFHAFRHCAVTNLALVLTGDISLATRLTGYDKTEILTIRQALLGVETHAQDRWYALAYLMGHISPERSFEYYNHVATLMATYAIHQAQYAKFFKFDSFTNITGFSKVRLKENGYHIDQSTFELANLRPLLLRLILQKTKPVMVKYAIDQPIVFDKIGNISVSDSLLTRYSTHQVLDFLRYLDAGYDNDKAAIEAGIEPNDAKVIEQNARFIAGLTTQKGKSRFTKDSQTLSPLAVQTHSEKKLQRLVFAQLKQLITHDKAKLDAFITLGLEKLTTEQPALSLSLAELQVFIPIAQSLTPDADKYWLIRYGGDRDVATVLASCDFSPTKQLKMTPHKSSSQTPRRKTKVCEIGLLYQKPIKTGTQNQFSALLRFMVHYGFLMMTSLI